MPLIDEKVVAEDDKVKVLHRRYFRANTAVKLHINNEIIREIAFIFRHSDFPICEMTIKEGQDILYTQKVIVKK